MKPRERSRASGVVIPAGAPSSAGISTAASAPGSGAGLRWLELRSTAMSSMALVGVVRLHRALVGGVANGLHDRLRAEEAVADRGLGSAVGQVPRPQHDQSGSPIELDPLGDGGVAADLLNGHHEGAHPADPAEGAN